MLLLLSYKLYENNEDMIINFWLWWELYMHYAEMLYDDHA